jgi:hypothetical protein
MITETQPDRSQKRPALVGFLAIALVASSLVWTWRPKTVTPPELPRPRASVAEPPTKTLTDGPELFRRAFWKRATAGDNVLHAERREWGDRDGLKKWQWFLVVEPSAELLRYLREENAFGLSPASALSADEETPDWFHFEAADFDTLRARTGNMLVSFHRSKALLYATDFGSGFTAGAKAPAPQPSEVSTQSAGRIPANSPPTPNE